ncbi:hypothetical protein PCASD_12604 [Puccinia coronata f. sp. avenae]|uniref:Uncharacterized protein n=1 Tax=Puccinia coronata f. sp. avenae TaxID=200324 RepID=A0A2N5TE16_9BASI|nr:hypothetical protein PCASD_12604 [Puccinia coronata f. sp. avenae]
MYGNRVERWRRNVAKLASPTQDASEALGDWRDASDRGVASKERVSCWIGKDSCRNERWMEDNRGKIVIRAHHELQTMFLSTCWPGTNCTTSVLIAEATSIGQPTNQVIFHLFSGKPLF